MSDAEFWKRKLLAFLHDPPCKALDVGPVHEEIALQFQRAALPGVDDAWLQETRRACGDADHLAAAADRLAFPTGKAAARFTGEAGATFKHPLGGSELVLGKLPTRDRAAELLQQALGGIEVDPAAAAAEQWRQRFFLYWRRWPEEAVRLAPALACFPADTRIPDHTIWAHLSVTSALEGCRVQRELRPAFLVFQLGPVQEFIAQARSTRDLWSGSYLLSWLTAHAIKAVTDEIGPDSVVFPALRGQGIFDALHRDEIYERVRYRAGADGATHTLWERLYLLGDGGDRERLARRLLNPTLPNRFVALAPEDRAAELAAAAETAVRRELQSIGDACWAAFEKLAMGCGANAATIPGWKERWDAQLRLFPQIAWQVQPWQHDIPAALEAFGRLPVNQPAKAATPGAILRAFAKLATADIPREDRDSRYFVNGDVTKGLNNAGFLWSANYHWAEFALAARRNTRDFRQFATDAHQAGALKDALSGREEVIGDEAFWRAVSDGQAIPVLRANEGPYGALTLVKRLWCRQESACLFAKLGLDEPLFRQAVGFESVPELACRNRAGQRPMRGQDEAAPRNPYVAAIALDGDRMGEWLSGAKTPRFLDQLAAAARSYLAGKAPADLRRALSPSYHLQFSEALANFATHVAGRIVRHYEGQLVYAGGDDVLALVPADFALACAQALRAAFRGRAADLPEPESNFDLAFQAEGFLLVDDGYPIVVPGPAAEVSCGIAIGHCNHPLQGLVREARAAARAAKHEHGRAAFRLHLIKRSGEALPWGAKWDSGALALYRRYRELRGEDPTKAPAAVLSSRFPYALAERLDPYRLDEAGRQVQGFPGPEILLAEFDRVCARQVQDAPAFAAQRTEFRQLAKAYLAALAGQRPLADFAGLFLAAAFIERDRELEEEA